MTTKTKRGGPRPGAGRKPKLEPLAVRAEAARLAAARRRKREQAEKRLALMETATAEVNRVLGPVKHNGWRSSVDNDTVETTIEGLLIQYDGTRQQEGLYVWAWSEVTENDDGYDWLAFEDLEDLGEILAEQPPPLDTTDDEARTAAMRVTLPDVD